MNRGGVRFGLVYARAHKSGSVIDVRFSPDATKLLHSSEMTQCAKTGQGLLLVSEEGRGP